MLGAKFENNWLEKVQHAHTRKCTHMTHMHPQAHTVHLQRWMHTLNHSCICTLTHTQDAHMMHKYLNLEGYEREDRDFFTSIHTDMYTAGTFFF
jgi:hypothetical protein